MTILRKWFQSVRRILAHLPRFKLPVWAIVVAFLAWQYQLVRENGWGVIAILLVYDLINSLLIAKDRSEGKPLGPVITQIKDFFKDEVKDELKGQAINSLGVPEHVASGLQASENRRNGTPDMSLGTRIFFNHTWSIFILFTCVYLWYTELK